MLATLDKSSYEEMQRQQVITVEQAKASHLQARLNLEIARLAVVEYRDGLVEETLKAMEGSLALARSNLSLAEDHLDWSQKMNGKGYSSSADDRLGKVQRLPDGIRAEQAALGDGSLPAVHAAQDRKEPSAAGDDRTRPRSPTKSSSSSARSIGWPSSRSKSSTARFVRLTMVSCIITKTPIARSRNQAVIEEGMSVRQRQELFYLPDLSELEVQMALNESVVNRVQPGNADQSADSKRCPDLELDGEVVSIGQFPASPGRDGEDFRYFLSRVKIDRDRAGPHARHDRRESTFSWPRRRNVLAVPLEAIRSVKGKKICYVVTDERLERRPVELGLDTTALIEITDGVQEGELVVLNPPPESSNLDSFKNSSQARYRPPLARVPHGGVVPALTPPTQSRRTCRWRCRCLIIVLQ